LQIFKVVVKYYLRIKANVYRRERCSWIGGADVEERNPAGGGGSQCTVSPGIKFVVNDWREITAILTQVMPKTNSNSTVVSCIVLASSGNAVNPGKTVVD